MLIALAVVLHQRAREGDLPPTPVVARPLRQLGTLLLVVVAAVLVVGTVVTGSGPHSGDVEAGRTGLDPETMSQLHADLVFLLVGVTVAFWLALKATGAPQRAVRAMGAAARRRARPGRRSASCSTSPGCRCCSSALHLVGACLTPVAAVHAVLALRDRGPLGRRPGCPSSASPGR